MLLIHPPQAKPGEPPAGVAMLAASLEQEKIRCTVVDLNIEMLYAVLQNPELRNDTWSQRAYKNRFRNIDTIRNCDNYNKPDRYNRAVSDINRLLENTGNTYGINLTLTNYSDPHLSPQKTEDLITAANQHYQNIYFSYFKKRLDDLLHNTETEHIGFSLNYLSQALCTFAMIGYLKKTYPEKKIIVGGGLVTTWFQLPGWDNPFGELIDHLVCGPGEQTLKSILGCSPGPSSASGDYSDLSKNNYLAPGFILPYSASTGCFWRKCLFCPETSEENPYHPHEINQVRKEVASLCSRYDVYMVHFLDNAISPALLKSLADHPLNVPWYGFARFSDQLTDPDFCRRLKASGCAMLKLGLESGNQGVLDTMGKGIYLDQAAKALKAISDAGILTYVYLLFGTPAESYHEAKDTLRYVVNHHESIHFLNLAIFNLPVGSPEVNDVKIKDLYEGDLSIYYDFYHPKGWERREVRRFLDTEFKKTPEIRRILQNDPPHFTSNHAPFFTHPLF